jgi:F-type H+-transporting ATPase subunit delta
MITGSIARRYARALLSIGVDQGNYEALGREVGDLARAMATSAELTDALTNPLFKRSQRRQLLDRMLTRIGASTATRNFFFLLLDRERMNVVPDIARELAAMIDERAGRVNAVVTSAQPLTPLQAQQLKATLEHASGRTVMMERQHDPSLLGGVVAKVGDLVYDGSLRTQLEQMRYSLVK